MSKTYEAPKNQSELSLEDAKAGLDVINQQFKPGLIPTVEQLDGTNLFLDEIANSDAIGDMGSDEALQNSYNFARTTADTGTWLLSQAETTKHERVINAINKGHTTANRGKLAKSREDDVDFLRDLYGQDGNKLSRRQGLKLYRDWLQQQVDLSQELKRRELAKPTRDMHPKVRNEVLANLGAAEPKKETAKPAKEAEPKPESQKAEPKNDRKPFRLMTRDERGAFFAHLVKDELEPKPQTEAKPESQAKPEREKSGWRAKVRHLGKSALTHLGIAGVKTGGAKKIEKASLSDLLGGREEIAEYVYSNGARHWYRVDENGNLLGQIKKADVEKYYDDLSDQPAKPAKPAKADEPAKPEKSSKQKEEATKRRRKWAALGLVAVTSLGLAYWGAESTVPNPNIGTNKPQPEPGHPQTTSPYNVEPGQTLTPKQKHNGTKNQNGHPKQAELVVKAGDYPWDVLLRAGVAEDKVMSDLEQAGQAYEHATGNNVQWYGSGKHRWVKVNGQSDTRDVINLLQRYIQVK